MERKSGKACDLEVGKRYAYSEFSPRSNWFTVLRKNKTGTYILYGDNLSGMFYLNDLVTYIEIPLSSLEKELA